MKNTAKDSLVEFKCPSCLKSSIKRNQHERRMGAKYECSSCGFSGPN